MGRTLYSITWYQRCFTIRAFFLWVSLSEIHYKYRNWCIYTWLCNMCVTDSKRDDSISSACIFNSLSFFALHYLLFFFICFSLSLSSFLSHSFVDFYPGNLTSSHSIFLCHRRWLWQIRSLQMFWWCKDPSCHQGDADQVSKRHALLAPPTDPYGHPTATHKLIHTHIFSSPRVASLLNDKLVDSPPKNLSDVLLVCNLSDRKLSLLQ